MANGKQRRRAGKRAREGLPPSNQNRTKKQKQEEKVMQPLILYIKNFHEAAKAESERLAELTEKWNV